MRRSARALAALALVLAPAAASAEATLPGITGNWGNESGCKMGRGGVREDEDMLLLTPSDVQNFVTFCSFLDVHVAGEEMVATVICGHEGDDLVTAGLMIIRKRAESPGALLITEADGNGWGEVRPCE
jgi:hypothetical protein